MSAVLPPPAAVFFRAWEDHAPTEVQVAPLRHTGDQASGSFAALTAAEQRTLVYALEDLQLPPREAAGLSGRLGQALVDWSREDGVDRDALRSRLAAAAS